MCIYLGVPQRYCFTIFGKISGARFNIDKTKRLVRAKYLVCHNSFPSSYYFGSTTGRPAAACFTARVGQRQRCVFTGRMPRSGKLPVLDLLTGQKSGFSPYRGDSLHRFWSNFAGPTGTWVRLAVQNFTPIGADGWECGPQNIKNFHFLVKSRPAGATPLTDFQNF